MMFLKTYIDSIHTRKRVVMALVLRESKSRFGESRMGFLWAFFEPLTQVFVFGSLFLLTDRQAPHGISVLPFMITGVLTFQLFSKTVTRCMGAIDSNKTLLSYPILKPVDTIIARAILEFFTYTMILAALLAVCYYIGIMDVMPRFQEFFLALILAAGFGFSLGTGAAAAAAFYPVVTKFVPIVTRFLFFTSGVFFSLSMMPTQIRDILIYNPVLNIMEMVRHGAFDNYPDSGFSLNYVLLWILFSLSLSVAVLGIAEKSPKARIRGN